MHPDWEPDRLATAAIFYSLHEADVAKGLLDSCGVDCFLVDEHMHRVHPLAGDVLGGIRLQVAAKDLQLAKQVLQGPFESDGKGVPGPIE